MSSGYDARPDYRVDVRRIRNMVRVRHGDALLAETTAALLVDEQDHGLVLYLPEADVAWEHLEDSEHTSVCPFKGTARYWTLRGTGTRAAWAYPEPAHQVARIAGHVAFYADVATVELGVATPAVSGR